MKISALISQSLLSIWNNKIRSGLTILGIVIGIAAVIALVGLGKGLEASVQSNLGDMDAKALTINAQDPDRAEASREEGQGGGPGGGGGGGGFVFSGESTETLTESDYQTIQDADHVEAASPDESSQQGVTLTADADTATSYTIYGIDTEYFNIKDIDLTEGDNLTSSQVEDGDNVVVVGSGAAEDLFPDEDEADIVGKTIYIDDSAYTIAGIIDQEESSSSTPMPGGGSSTNDAIFTGYKNWLELNDKDEFSSIAVTVDNEENVDAATESIETALMEAHDITDEDKADFSVVANQELLETMQSVSSSFTTTLTGIAAISLVVGGIGIMNIMLVTVTERTREIGLRRAVGAKKRHVLIQFLTESILLTFIGGIMGLIIGVGFSSQAGNLLSIGGMGGQTTEAIVDVGTAMLAVSISGVIGVVFGLFPAIKASKLDPVEALRYE